MSGEPASPQQVERGRRVAVLLPHQNSEGLVDDAPGGHRLRQSAVHRGLAHLPQLDRQRSGTLCRERLRITASRSGERSQGGRVQVQG
jgi:hypothetical protein